MTNNYNEFTKIKNVVVCSTPSKMKMTKLYHTNFN